MSSFTSFSKVCRSCLCSSSSESSSFSSKKKKKNATRISPPGKQRYRREFKEEDEEDIDGQFAIIRFKQWLKSLQIETTCTSEFVFTRKMGIGGIVLEDKEEQDLIFRIPLGERRRTSRGVAGTNSTETTLPTAMRWDVFLRADCEQLGFSSKLGEIFVKEQLASKLRGVLIEDDEDEDDEDGANASSSFPLDSTRTSMLAMALMYQDLKARSTRRAEELGGENGDEKEESSGDDYSPHWQAYVDLLPTNVDSLLLWSMEELAFLQNSRIGERAKRRKKLVAEEFQVLFSNASLREEFERLMMTQTKQTQTSTSPLNPRETIRRRRQRQRLTPFRFETLREWFEWAYATVLARAFTLPEIENGALLLCPGLDIFNSARDAAKCEVRLSPHDDISLHATVGGYRAGTQAFHDYADKSSGGALLEFGFIYDDDERLNFPLFMDDDDEKEKANESTTFIYEGATEIEISATAVLRDFLTHPRVLEKCKQLDVLAPSSTTERPVLRKFLLSNVTEMPWDSSAETKILHPSFQCVSKDLLDIVQTIERECITTTKTPTTTTTASSLLRRIYKREFARYSATSIAEDLTALRRIQQRLKVDGTEERRGDKNRKQRSQKRVLVALKLRLSEKILLRACLNDTAFASS
ncbi:unnamed protein product [Bathycoccus prasinos]